MASVSYSIEQTVDDRLTKYQKATNKIRKIPLESRTEVIHDLLTKAGF